jgi:hypothetical protein
LAPADILGIKSTNPNFIGQILKAPRAETEYDISAFVKPLGIGRQVGNLVIATNSKFIPELIVPIRAIIGPSTE